MNKEQITKMLKNKNNRTIFLIFIIGVALMIIAGGYKADGAHSAAGTWNGAVNEEDRLGEILSQIDGAGNVSVMISYTGGAGGEDYPRPLGVIVTAEGADNPRIKKAIYEAVEASLDVSAHRICIFKKEEE